MGYQGPHASVTQEFVTSPVATAIESLPPAVVASAFDVFRKEQIGSHIGIEDSELAWADEDGNSIDKVVYDKDVIDQRSFDFYPPEIFGNDEDFVEIPLETTAANIKSTGVTVPLDKDYSIPGVKVETSSKAIMPFYKKLAEIVAPAASAEASAAGKLTDTSEDFSSAGLAIQIGDLVENTSSYTTALVTNIDTPDATNGIITLDTDILNNTDGYVIYRPIKINAGATSIINVPGGAMATAQVQAGQNVFIRRGTVASGDNNWTAIGTVTNPATLEGKIQITTTNTVEVFASEIVIGSAAKTNALRNIPNTIFDPTATFLNLKVRAGDIVHISSLSLANSVSTAREASIALPPSPTTLFINTEALVAGQVDYKFEQYEAFEDVVGSTIKVSAYDVKRLVGFSENYGLKEIDDGVQVTRVSDSEFTITYVDGAFTVPSLNPGDLFMISNSLIAAGDEEREEHSATMVLYRIADIIHDAGAQLHRITADAVIKQSDDGTTDFATLDYLHAWNVKIETPILGDFRAVRSEEENVVKRITSETDIYTAFVRPGHDLDSKNELAFMMSIALSRSGGRVCYGVNVDASGSNLTSEYNKAFEELKKFDVYSHILGTTNGGVNGSLAPYLNGQAAPYEAHERIGLVTYDQKEVFLMGQDTGEITAGTITIGGGGFNILTAGLTVGDKVEILDSNENIIEEVTVTATPTVVTTILTDGVEDYGSGHIFKFRVGRVSQQAIKVGNLGVGERRVTVIWPGYFTADIGNGLEIVPPYYLAAAIGGMDSGKSVAQSFTNLDFGVPSLSNATLDTNFYFSKLDLDEMGGNGIDIIIADDSTGNTVLKSRHDLTSNSDNIQFRERSITKQGDNAAKAIRAAIAPYVGKYNVGTRLFTFLGGIISSVSSILIKRGDIASLTLVSIDRDPVIDDKLNIKMNATAFVAGNYFDVTLLITTR